MIMAALHMVNHSKTIPDAAQTLAADQNRAARSEERDFFPAALEALKPQDWTEIASAVTDHKDPLFSDATEERFDALRAHILRLEQEAEAERK